MLNLDTDAPDFKSREFAELRDTGIGARLSCTVVRPEANFAVVAGKP